MEAYYQRQMKLFLKLNITDEHRSKIHQTQTIKNDEIEKQIAEGEQLLSMSKAEINKSKELGKLIDDEYNSQVDQDELQMSDLQNHINQKFTNQNNDIETQEYINKSADDIFNSIKSVINSQIKLNKQ